jgi:hypothetical protein
MSLTALFALLWPSAPALQTPPDVLIATDEAGSEVRVTRRVTNRSKRIYIEVWRDAKVVVDGQTR